MQTVRIYRLTVIRPRFFEENTDILRMSFLPPAITSHKLTKQQRSDDADVRQKKDDSDVGLRRQQHGQPLYTIFPSNAIFGPT